MLHKKTSLPKTPYRRKKRLNGCWQMMQQSLASSRIHCERGTNAGSTADAVGDPRDMTFGK